jgi:hypothetical protein
MGTVGAVCMILDLAIRCSNSLKNMFKSKCSNGLAYVLGNNAQIRANLALPTHLTHLKSPDS